MCTACFKGVALIDAFTCRTIGPVRMLKILLDNRVIKEDRSLLYDLAEQSDGRGWQLYLPGPLAGGVLSAAHAQGKALLSCFPPFVRVFLFGSVGRYSKAVTAKADTITEVRRVHKRPLQSLASRSLATRGRHHHSHSGGEASRGVSIMLLSRPLSLALLIGGP